jgi:hypothetical protein
LSTVNPAFFASENETVFAVLKLEIIFRTGFRHEGQTFNSGALSGRRNENRPPQTAHPPSHNSYS